MPTPVWTTIMNEVGARLGLISPANGYNTTVKTLERSRANPFKTDDLPAMTYWKVNDRFLDKKFSLTQRDLRVAIEFYSKSNDGDLDLLTDNFFSDLFVALYRNPANPLVTDNPEPMFQDKKFIVTIDTLQPITSGGNPRLGVICIISLTYWVKNTDPFTLV